MRAARASSLRGHMLCLHIHLADELQLPARKLILPNFIRTASSIRLFKLSALSSGTTSCESVSACWGLSVLFLVGAVELLTIFDGGDDDKEAYWSQVEWHVFRSRALRGTAISTHSCAAPVRVS